MKHVKKSVLLAHSAHDIYALVIDVEAYPQFLPWCRQVDVLDRDEDGLTARLHLGFSGINQAFTTKNVQVPDESVHLQLVDGPFSTFDGMWRFVALAGAGGAGDAVEREGAGDAGLGAACRVEFELRYAFAGRLLDAVVSPVFDRIADTLVDSFVRRAEQVYAGR